MLPESPRYYIIRHKQQALKDMFRKYLTNENKDLLNHNIVLESENFNEKMDKDTSDGHEPDKALEYEKQRFDENNDVDSYSKPESDQKSLVEEDTDSSTKTVAARTSKDSKTFDPDVTSIGSMKDIFLPIYVKSTFVGSLTFFIGFTAYTCSTLLMTNVLGFLQPSGKPQIGCDINCPDLEPKDVKYLIISPILEIIVCMIIALYTDQVGRRIFVISG